MGIPINQIPEKIFARMTAKDRKLYAAQPPAAIRSPPKAERLEREEQRAFAKWCTDNGIPYVWHSTAHRTKASLGCPDFIVQTGGSTLWIEFKRADCRLTPEQENFRDRLLRHAALYFVVSLAGDAIALTRKHQYQ